MANRLAQYQDKNGINEESIDAFMATLPSKVSARLTSAAQQLQLDTPLGRLSALSLVLSLFRAYMTGKLSTAEYTRFSKMLADD